MATIQCPAEHAKGSIGGHCCAQSIRQLQKHGMMLEKNENKKGKPEWCTSVWR